MLQVCLLILNECEKPLQSGRAMGCGASTEPTKAVCTPVPPVPAGSKEGWMEVDPVRVALSSEDMRRRCWK